MNTCQQELSLLRKTCHNAMPDILLANEKIHLAMGVEKEAFDAHGQLIMFPWHMPLPKELQRQHTQAPRHVIAARRGAAIVAGKARTFLSDGAASGQVPRMSKKKAQPSNKLERSLHNKQLAQRLSSSGPALPVSLQSRDTNLPILSKPDNVGKSKEVANNTLKRKHSEIKLPSDSKEKSLADLVPNLSIQPKVRQILHISESISDSDQIIDVQKESEHPQSVENEKKKSESPSPPRRHFMPPISIILAHGFRDLNIEPIPPPPTTPRSHAFDPWTILRFGHRVLTPTPAFLLSMTPFQYDDSDDSYYWKSSLPMILSYHLANPATLVHETKLQDLTFHLPVPKPTLIIGWGNRRQLTNRVREPHYKSEGPETDTEIRLIRMILPPTLPDKSREQTGQGLPFTDWLLLCMSNITPAVPTSSHNLRSSSQALQQPYLLIAFPTGAITSKMIVARSPVISPVDQVQQISTTTMLKFSGKGRLPLVFGVNRDVNFVDRWVRGFGLGQAGLEVTMLGNHAPCWL